MNQRIQSTKDCSSVVHSRKFTFPSKDPGTTQELVPGSLRKEMHCIVMSDSKILEAKYPTHGNADRPRVPKAESL